MYYNLSQTVCIPDEAQQNVRPHQKSKLFAKVIKGLQNSPPAGKKLNIHVHMFHKLLVTSPNEIVTSI